jgi:hypothetical protein
VLLIDTLRLFELGKAFNFLGASIQDKKALLDLLQAMHCMILSLNTLIRVNV